MAEKKSVMLALSGGVDSSVCASLLKEAGYDVHSVVMKMSEAHKAVVEAAKKAADALNIPITVLDLQNEFKKLVIEPFMSDYQNARTPNPCIICNPLIKFKYLKEAADREGCDLLATGHYARISSQNGRFFIKKAASSARDQSYMLYRLPQGVLSRLILPLSELSKDEIRAKAKSLDLFCADAPDSQENCFIPDNDYAKYILEHGGQNKAGFFISPEGKKIGAHKGIIHYTVGQRKGLGVALGRPVFVNRIDAESGDVHLTFAGGQMRDKIEVESCVFQLKETLCEPIRADVKIRSAARAQSALITPLESGRVSVLFDESVSAPASGQSAVFYVDDAVLGGGFIV